MKPGASYNRPPDVVLSQADGVALCATWETPDGSSVAPLLVIARWVATSSPYLHPPGAPRIVWRRDVEAGIELDDAEIERLLDVLAERVNKRVRDVIASVSAGIHSSEERALVNEIEHAIRAVQR